MRCWATGRAWTALAIVLAAAACRQSAPREADPEPAVPVIAEAVVLGNIRGTVSATGLVETLPGGTFTVVAVQPGKITEVTKNVGEAVKGGETLVRFEFPSLHAQNAVNSAAAKAAELRVQQTRLHQEHVRMLVGKGAASLSEMETADREAQMADADLTAARAALNLVAAQGQYTTITAPFNGTVLERYHNPGDTVRAEEGDPILRIVDPKQVQIMATVSVADASRFTVGATAHSVAEGRQTADLLHVASRPQPETGAKTVTVMLAFDTPTELAPGTQVGIEIDAEQRSNVPLVPAVAVVKEPTGAVVVVATGNIAQRRPVVTGLMDGQHIEILSGVKAGELVITQGQNSLRDGTPISVSAP